MSSNPVFDRIEQEIKESPVVLYMKGTPMYPQCGFSAAVVEVLTQLGIVFKGVDVMVDPSLREGLKLYASWPTFPQLYVKGELVGGCDIVREMHASGELKRHLEGNGVATQG